MYLKDSFALWGNRIPNAPPPQSSAGKAIPNRRTIKDNQPVPPVTPCIYTNSNGISTT
ncbi:hypothetical protein OG21DRAFT_1517756 [Imleria badia]|nr:hypothetical protein OG21DRAFT_1517756 [Imleria badia]